MQKHIQKSGENLVKNLHKKACKILKISLENYTTYCWKCSVTTYLVDRGISYIDLKKHSQWKLDAVVAGHIANNEPIRERERCLLPASLVVLDPSPSPEPNDIPTFTNLQGFLQLYNNELEVSNKISPDLFTARSRATSHRCEYKGNRK